MIRGGYTTVEKNRRQAEINDYTDKFTPYEEGLGVYTTLRIPAGRYILSFYSNNKDGDSGDNRWRDHRLSSRPHSPNAPLYAIRGFENEPELARGRVRNHRNGVWKRFWVQGPQYLTMKMDRNYSFMPTLSGIALDKEDEMPAPYFKSWTKQRVLDDETQATANYAKLRAGDTRDTFLSSLQSGISTGSSVLMRIVSTLNTLKQSNPVWFQSQSRTFYLPLTRFLAQTDSSEKVLLLPDAYYHLGMFNEWEEAQRANGLEPARDIEKALSWNGEEMVTGRGREFIEAYKGFQHTPKEVVPQ
jgi:hypothetical protein